MGKKEIEFEFERATKNTYKFQEKGLGVHSLAILYFEKAEKESTMLYYRTELGIFMRDWSTQASGQISQVPHSQQLSSTGGNK
jgi:hypothetical protein